MATRSGPETEQQLIALAAATGARRAAMRGTLEGLTAAADWPRLTAELGGARLLPTLGPRIVEIAAGRAPEDFGAAVTASIEACRRQDALLALISARVEGALSGAGIRATGLKGSALGEAVYGEPGRRLSGDIDLLVAPGQLDEAVAVVRDLGYGRPTDHVEANGLPLLHFALSHERGELPPVELHWRIHWYEDRFAEDCLLTSELGRSDWRPQPVHELAALLLFYARDGFTGLRQAADIGAWWDRFGAGLEQGALDRVVHAYPRLGPALEAASLVSEQVIGVPLSETLGREPRLGSRGRVAVRFVDPRPYASAAQLFAEIGLIDGLLTPSDAFGAYLRRQVAPPLEVIRDHAEKAQSKKVGSPLGYSIRILGRYTLAFGRLLHIPFAERARFPT
jgi:hypothetical protein